MAQGKTARLQSRTWAQTDMHAVETRLMVEVVLPLPVLAQFLKTRKPDIKGLNEKGKNYSTFGRSHRKTFTISK